MNYQPLWAPTPPLDPRQDAAASRADRHTLILKLFMICVVLPEGLSLFLGDFRLPLYRILIIASLGIAVRNARLKTGRWMSVRIPSDILALAAGAWMLTAGVVNDGLAVGLKGAGADALEFTGSYYVFRHLLGPVNSSVEVMKFACLVMIPVIVLALLDPLTGHLFTHDLITSLTGYFKPYDFNGESYIRDGLYRAMGSFEHSILFATACVWFTTIALFTFRFSTLGVGVALMSLIGIWFSQARGPLMVDVLGAVLMLYYAVMKRYTFRWRIVGALVAAWIALVFSFSRSPVSTLVSFGGVDASAGWYRQAIWATAGPMVLDSPMFGIGSIAGEGWWADNPVLTGPTMDSLWLVLAFEYGIPCSILVILTTAGAFWTGPLDTASSLTESERRLSVALGIVVSLSALLGFIVHMWGPPWVLLGVFPAIRANLAEAAIVRDRQSYRGHE